MCDTASTAKWDRIALGMLHDFLTTNRNELIIRCKAEVARRSSDASPVDNHGVPLFLRQLADTLYRDHFTMGHAASKTQKTPAITEIGRAAAFHGAELLRNGYTVDQVVHNPGKRNYP